MLYCTNWYLVRGRWQRSRPWSYWEHSGSAPRPDHCLSSHPSHPIPSMLLHPWHCHNHCSMCRDNCRRCLRATLRNCDLVRLCSCGFVTCTLSIFKCKRCQEMLYISVRSWVPKAHKQLSIGNRAIHFFLSRNKTPKRDFLVFRFRWLTNVI